MSASLVRQPGALGRSAGAAVAGRRFQDPTHGCWMVKVLPGEFYVADSPDEILVTVLGSCVAACIRDPVTGIGGMNHFMLPQGGRSWGEEQESARFGNFAMEKLVNELLKTGCARHSLEIKVFGGGNVIASSAAIGTSNANFVLQYLDEEGLACVAQDLGGIHPRRIEYRPSTGKVVRKLLGVGESQAVARDESEYARGLTTHRTSGDIELFG